MAIKLTEDQKQFLRDNFQEHPDLNVLVKMLFEDDGLDGRSKEGRAVRAFLAEEELEYKTISHEKVPEVHLTKEQQEIIIEKMELGLNSYHISNLVFSHLEKKLTPLCKEAKKVQEFMNTINPDYQPAEQKITTDYSPPKAMSRVIKRVNDSAGLSIDEEKMNRQVQRCLERLRDNLNNSRFVAIMNNFTHESKRNMFEDEFIRHTWEKPDLTPEDITLYFNLCKEIVSLEDCSKHIEMLKDMFEEAARAGQDQKNKGMSVTLSEAIKAKTDEYHKNETRIGNLIKKLQQDRSDRLKNLAATNASILSLVECFQEEDDRNTMIMIAEKQKEAVASAVEEFETMPEFKARILGLNKRDVL